MPVGDWVFLNEDGPGQTPDGSTHGRGPFWFGGDQVFFFDVPNLLEDHESFTDVYLIGCEPSPTFQCWDWTQPSGNPDLGEFHPGHPNNSFRKRTFGAGLKFIARSGGGCYIMGVDLLTDKPRLYRHTSLSYEKEGVLLPGGQGRYPVWVEYPNNPPPSGMLSKDGSYGPRCVATRNGLSAYPILWCIGGGRDGTGCWRFIDAGNDANGQGIWSRNPITTGNFTQHQLPDSVKATRPNQCVQIGGGIFCLFGLVNGEVMDKFHVYWPSHGIWQSAVGPAFEDADVDGTVCVVRRREASRMGEYVIFAGHGTTFRSITFTENGFGEWQDLQVGTGWAPERIGDLMARSHLSGVSDEYIYNFYIDDGEFEESGDLTHVWKYQAVDVPWPPDEYVPSPQPTYPGGIVEAPNPNIIDPNAIPQNEDVPHPWVEDAFPAVYYPPTQVLSPAPEKLPHDITTLDTDGDLSLQRKLQDNFEAVDRQGLALEPVITVTEEDGETFTEAALHVAPEKLPHIITDQDTVAFGPSLGIKLRENFEALERQDLALNPANTDTSDPHER